MKKILILDNEERDVECLIDLLDEIEPGVVDHVESVEEALKVLKKRIRDPYDALIVDYHLGSDDIEADIDGDYFLHILDGNLEKVITSGYCQRSEIDSARDFKDLRKIKNADNNIIDVLEEVYGSLGKYRLFVKELSTHNFVKIIFAGEYDGTYTKVDGIIIKNPQDGECGVDVVKALADAQILEEHETTSVLTDRGLIPFE